MLTLSAVFSRGGEAALKAVGTLAWGAFSRKGRHPLDGLRRELGEEAGVEIEPLDFLGIWIDRYGEDDSGSATLNFYWVRASSRVTRRRPTTSRGSRWFTVDEIPAG